MDIAGKFFSKRFWIVILIVAVFILAITGCASMKPSPRMSDHVFFFDLDLSDMRLSEAELLLNERIGNYSLQVTVGDQSFIVYAEDIGLVFNIDKFEQIAPTLKGSIAKVDLLNFISVDQDKILSFLKDNFDEKRIASTDPEIKWDASQQSFYVIEGKAGSWYSSEILMEEILHAVLAFSNELKIDENTLFQEDIDDELFLTAVTLANRGNELLNLNLEYVFAPRKIELARVSLDATTIASFLRFDLSNNVIYADPTAVQIYAESFSSAYDYEGYRDCFVTNGGERISIGVNVKGRSVDVGAFAMQIADHITKGISGTHEVPYTGFLNFDGKYIEVCIPEQHLWVYENGEVIFDSIVVTGIHGVRDTPTGVFAIGGHLQEIFLQEGYFVDYWMSFSTDGMYGFHDGDHWRQPEDYAFGTYMTNGSSGCVNVPVENMAKMYEIVEDGTLVVIYDYYHYN